MILVPPLWLQNLDGNVSRFLTWLAARDELQKETANWLDVRIEESNFIDLWRGDSVISVTKRLRRTNDPNIHPDSISG